MDNVRANFKDEGQYTRDGLVLGNYPTTTRDVIIEAGQVLTRGAILEPGGDPTKFVHLATAANAQYILAEDRDATDGDLTAVVYATGEFALSRLTVSAGAPEDCIDALEARNVYLRKDVQ